MIKPGFMPAAVCSDESTVSNGAAAGETIDLPPESRGPAAAASSSQDERDAYSSTEDMVLQSAEDLRELRSRCSPHTRLYLITKGKQ